MNNAHASHTPNSNFTKVYATAILIQIQQQFSSRWFSLEDDSHTAHTLTHNRLVESVSNKAIYVIYFFSLRFVFHLLSFGRLVFYTRLLTLCSICRVRTRRSPQGMIFFCFLLRSFFYGVLVLSACECVCMCRRVRCSHRHRRNRHRRCASVYFGFVSLFLCTT